MLYLIAPEFSGVESREATKFNEAVVEAIGDHEDCIQVSTMNQLMRAQSSLAPRDGVAFFAAEDPTRIHDSLVNLLRRAHGQDVAVLPVAIDQIHRALPIPFAEAAPFVPYDWLTVRELPTENLASVARQFAWSFLVSSLPTFAHQEMRVFLSYSRKSSEDLARNLQIALDARGNYTVRDNRDLHIGQDVRTAIERALEQCDVLVLLDTEGAQTSEWVEWELWTAVSKEIPIVWVDCDAPTRDGIHNYRPGSTPDISVSCASKDSDSLADNIDQAARAKLLGSVPAAQGFIGRLDDLAVHGDADISAVEPRNGIYEVTYPVASSPYPTRRRRHVVQVFARRPRRDDRDSLQKWLIDNGYLTQGRSRTFDAAIMASTAPGNQLEPDDGYSVSESAERYLHRMAAEVSAHREEPVVRPGLLLFGALPKGPTASDEVKRAARNVTATWLRLGGNVTFGGHPTITWHVIHGGAEAIGNEASRNRVHLYQSAHWPDQKRIEEMRQIATVVAVPEVENNREASLERMRQRMIEESDAVAAIAIGGRTTEGGSHSPGVRDEAVRASAAGIPVFPLGATGGETALLAAENTRAGTDFEQLNDATGEDNSWLSVTDDYSGAAVVIWRSVVA